MNASNPAEAARHLALRLTPALTLAPTFALTCALACCLALGLASPAHAEATPAGLWKTIDDSTHQERSLVRITEVGGVYTGRIEKALNPDPKQAKVCDQCTDERKGQPLIGMAIIRNTHQSADDKAVFDGGDITDPDNGKVYRLRLRPIDDGRKLEVRGYIGPFYRTQIWLRAD
jgi:uncharacterized protein (DUF2147 family)